MGLGDGKATGEAKEINKELGYILDAVSSLGDQLVGSFQDAVDGASELGDKVDIVGKTMQRGLVAGLKESVKNSETLIQLQAKVTRGMATQKDIAKESEKLANNQALLDARRGLKMFEKVNIPIIGIVENMATHLCTECGHEEHIFGANGGEKMSKDYDCELLGSLPLDISIRENLDKGLPSVAKDPNSIISEIYKLLALKAALKVAKLSEDHTSKFPNIVIQKS
jgi:predicted RNA-binding Zn-ribbon protein involved in translation (DUF1610 family)